MEELSIICVATSDEGYLDVLKKNAKDKNINLYVLGYGEKWQGLWWKSKKYLEYLDNCEPDEIVMIVDGYDVIIPGTKNGIINKFKNFDTDIVISCEPTLSYYNNSIYSNIHFYIVKKYFNCKTEYLLNSGTIIGYADKMKILFQRMLDYNIKNDIKDDQYALNSIKLDDINYKLDIYTEIFWVWRYTSLYDDIYFLLYKHFPNNLYDVKIDENKRPIFKNGVMPEIIHGIGQRDMKSFIDDDKYNHRSRKISQLIKVDDINNDDNNNNNNTNSNYTYYIYCIIIIILVYFIYCKYKKKIKSKQ
jgi:hypothetical protein